MPDNKNRRPARVETRCRRNAQWARCPPRPSLLQRGIRPPEQEIQDRAEEWQQDDNDDPDDLVGTVALDAVHERHDPEDEPDDREEIIQVYDHVPTVSSRHRRFPKRWPPTSGRRSASIASPPRP